MKKSASQTTRPKRATKKPRRYKSTSENDSQIMLKRAKTDFVDTSLKDDIEDIHRELRSHDKKTKMSQSLCAASTSFLKVMVSKYQSESRQATPATNIVPTAVSPNRSSNDQWNEKSPPDHNSQQHSQHNNFITPSYTEDINPIQSTYSERPEIVQNSFHPANTEGLKPNYFKHPITAAAAYELHTRGPYNPIPLRPSCHDPRISPANQSYFGRTESQKQSTCDLIQLLSSPLDSTPDLNEGVGQIESNTSSKLVPPKVKPHIIHSKIIVPGSSGTLRNADEISTASNSAAQTTKVRETHEPDDSLKAEIQRLHNIISTLVDTFTQEITLVKNQLRDLTDELRDNISPRIPRKPAFIPTRRAADVEFLETMNRTNYRELVQYLKYVGGLTMREAFNNSLKECLTDECCMKFTYWGTETCHSFYDKKIATAIYEAVAANRHLPFKPTLAHFEEEMKECIRTAKQRHRNSQKAGEPQQRRESALKQKKRRAQQIFSAIQRTDNEQRRDEEENEEEGEEETDEEENYEETEYDEDMEYEAADEDDLDV